MPSSYIIFFTIRGIANLNTVDENHILKYIMTATDYDTLFAVASFVKDAFEEVKNILSSLFG